MSDDSLIFDKRLKTRGGFRDAKTGRIVRNPNIGKPHYCPRSPTLAHYWHLDAHGGRCKYCEEERTFQYTPRRLTTPKSEQGAAWRGPS